MTLRVMTFNIRQFRALDGDNRWSRRRDLVFDVIARHRPDVLGAQEVHARQLQEFLDRLGSFGAIAHRRYGGIIGAYAPIFFDADRVEPAQSGDFWLAAEPDGRKRKGWDAAAARICTWAAFRDRSDDRRFVVFNSHFDNRGKVAQVESARLVVERLARFAHVPRLFTSDLNANESSEAFEILVASGLRDSFRVVRPDEQPSFTYHRFRGAKSRGVLGKIDHIMCDDAWDVLGAEIVRDSSSDGRLPSDHYPVTAELALRHDR